MKAKKAKKVVRPNPLVIPCEPHWEDLGNGIRGKVTGHVQLTYAQLKAMGLTR